MNEPKFEKFGLVQKSAGVAPDLEKINAQTRVPLKAEEVCIFRIAACDDRVDRDHERFTADCLRGLAPMFVGRPVLLDHQWSATTQTARVYDAAVEKLGEDHRLVLYCYLPVTESARDTIIAINAGILREVSVGCAVGKAACSICGADKTKTRCEHRPGQTYDGRACVVELSEPTDAYEVSFVAVPAQPKAGVVKKYGGEDEEQRTDQQATMDRSEGERRDAERPKDQPETKGSGACALSRSALDSPTAEKQKALALLELAEYA